MAYFEDLSVNTYSNVPEAGCLSVGWLAKGEPFRTGQTSETFRAALDNLCKNHTMSHCFGHHVCEFCPDATLRDAYFFNIGNGEIKVRSANGTWYVAPRLITHYVVEHCYCPPKEFIEAVLEPSEIGQDTRPRELTEEQEIKRVKERELQSRENVVPPIDVKAIVRQGTREALRHKPWWRFW